MLQSCKGFKPDTYHMWCCTKRQCNILYTKQAIADLGYDPIDELQLFQCFSSERSAGMPQSALPASGAAASSSDASADTEASRGGAGADGGDGTVQTPETSDAHAFWQAPWWAVVLWCVAAATPC